MKTERRILSSPCEPAAASRFIGIDAGAETLKIVELVHDNGRVRVARREIIQHGKRPGPVLIDVLRRWDWSTVAGAAVTGRFAPQINLARAPTKQAQLRGYRFFFGDEPTTIINIGSHGFSVLELRASGQTVFRENSRCSQGTGNFLRQLVERFSLTVEEASALCADVPNPAPLSGRCPVILKTDMTHLANKGEDRARILAGLFDAVCENVFVLLKPGTSPPRVLLTGGVSRAPRVRRVFGEMLARNGMSMLKTNEEEILFLEAVGCALIALDCGGVPPHSESDDIFERRQGAAAVQNGSAPSRVSLDELVLPPRELKLERLPALTDSLDKVRRMPTQPWAQVNGEMRRLVLGFDIGSTGSKLVAMDISTNETIWEGYRQTLGDPVGAAQELLRRFTKCPAAGCAIVAFGATGSGREITGSLLTSCYGKDAVFIVNEIVAHATGALHYDRRVDTIFEIGGQDAKYIRLAGGRIIDCAMNEACSAGTGSFIEEQGRKFAGIEDVRQLGSIGLAAQSGVSLGQHCSVFMAEVIDDAVAAGIEQGTIISGLYDSIIKNYLNRVKGNRSVGKVIFCQGMPFSADALAAAVARQTGSEVIVPPNPGTVGALGIALLAARELNASSLSPVDPLRFLEAKLEQKDAFVCGSNRGCGGAGNHCRIERLRTIVNCQRSSFTWGGGCALHDKGTRKRKLPDLAPDPFRERGELLQRFTSPFTQHRGVKRIAISDEFMLKGLFPFFAAFFHAAGFDLEIVASGGPETLKRGIQIASVPFCAPMQLFHGTAEKLFATGADWIFIPMLRSLPGAKNQGCTVVCPIVQSAPDVMKWTLERSADFQSAVSPNCIRQGDGLPESRRTLQTRDTTEFNSAPRAKRLLSPIIDFDAGNLESPKFMASCKGLAAQLSLSEERWHDAWVVGARMQEEFQEACVQIGRRALEFCRERNIVPVVVLGRNYTIYNQVLNSNVPAILREQGAIGVPVDCFPLEADTPLFADMYWAHGQNMLRAAHQVRRARGVYALYCSNYSCGPDSFNLHFAAYVMEGKPFAIIETDGHSGDAGTRTRVEAFLHCVEEDRRSSCSAASVNDFRRAQFSGLRLAEIHRNNGSSERLLVPYIGPASEAVAAIFRGSGMHAESLPPPDSESLRIGRRYTSGKECLPMPLTLGSLIQRLQRANENERFAYLMTSTNGPCRFGVYNLLNNIVLERLGWRGRVRIWSPKDSGYFDDMKPGTEILVMTAISACDLLLQAKLDVRPAERIAGEADRIHGRWHSELLKLVENVATGKLALGPSLWEVFSGRLFGVPKLLRRAATEFAEARNGADLPVVELVGEIYVRGVDFGNDFLIAKLEQRGLCVHLATKCEWINYCTEWNRREGHPTGLARRFSTLTQHRIETAEFTAMGQQLRWRMPPSSGDLLDTAAQYINPALGGEAILTVGAPLHEWRHGQIDAAINVGPLECMPTKIAEAQFQHVAEREGLLTLTIALNGDPISDSVLDNFAYEVKARARQRRWNSAKLEFLSQR